MVAFRANYNDFGGSTCTTFTHRFGDFSSHDLTIHPGQEDGTVVGAFHLLNPLELRCVLLISGTVDSENGLLLRWCKEVLV